MGGVLLKDNNDPAKYHEQQADFVTGSPMFVDNDHAYIHKGFSYTGGLTTNAATESINFLLCTPADKYVHFRPVQVSTVVPAVIVSLYENSTLTSTDGTAVSLINRNRNSGSTAASILRRTTQPSTSATTTLLDTEFVGGGTGVGAARSGATISGQHEFVLKKSSVYPITVTGSSANAIGVKFFLYEEDEG